MKKLTRTIKKLESAAKAIYFRQTSDRKVGQLLSILCASKPNGNFLELGTGCGLSTAYMLHGMSESSTLVSVDSDENLVSIARKYLGKDKRLTLFCDKGEDVIDDTREGSIDIIFADTWPGKYHCLNETLELLKVGGIYLIDDMLPQNNWPMGHEERVKKLIQSLQSRDDLVVSYLSWATGVYICTKISINNKESNSWDPEAYNKYAGFVSELALPMVDLLDPQVGERILDVGCGEGVLAVEIARLGADVVGVDMSKEMVEFSISRGVDARVCSVTDLDYEDEFDALFSNAVLHWVKEPKEAVDRIYKALKMGGRFVCEFGGEGNVYNLVKAMESVFKEHPEFGQFNNPWYFPSVKEYRDILEANGFEVEYIELITRPTAVEDISNWIDVFTKGVTANLTQSQFTIFKSESKEILKKSNYTKEQGWVVDYVRLRLKAVKR